MAGLARRYLLAQRAWEQAHPDESWWASPDYVQIQTHEPVGEPEERTCTTCDGHGVGDLIAAGIAELADAAERAWRHLGTWRSEHRDLSDARDTLEALRLAEHEAVAAAEKLRAELAHAEPAQRLPVQPTDR